MVWVQPHQLILHHDLRARSGSGRTNRTDPVRRLFDMEVPQFLRCVLHHRSLRSQKALHLQRFRYVNVYDCTGHYEQLPKKQQVGTDRFGVLRLLLQLLRSDWIPWMQLPLCDGSSSNSSAQ